MAVTDELFTLIKSLTRAERRQYSMYAKIKGGEQNNYLKVFDYLCQQDEYNEDNIKRKFKKEIFIKHFPSLVHRLYLNILQALNEHSMADPDQQLHIYIKNVELLYNKGLISQASRMMQKAKEQAKELENLQLLLQVLDWERNIISELQPADQEKRLNDIAEESEKVLAELNILNELSNVYADLNFRSSKQFRLRTEKEKEEFLSKYGKYIHKCIDTEYTITKLRLLETQSNIFNKLQEKDKLDKVLNEAIQLYENNHNLLLSAHSKYSILLQRQFVQNIFDKDLNRSADCLKKMKEAPATSEYLTIQNRRIYLQNLFLFQLNFEKDPDLESTAREIQEFLEKHKNALRNSNLIIFYNNLTTYYFIHHNYSETLTWVNKIMDEVPSDLKKDSQAFQRILRLIIHYELRNFNVVDDFYRQTHRFISKKIKMQVFEKKVLNFIRRLNQIADPADIKSECVKFLAELEQFKGNQNGIPLTGYDEVTLWLKSKITGKKIIDQVMESRL